MVVFILALWSENTISDLLLFVCFWDCSQYMQTTIFTNLLTVSLCSYIEHKQFNMDQYVQFSLSDVCKCIRRKMHFSVKRLRYACRSRSKIICSKTWLGCCQWIMDCASYIFVVCGETCESDVAFAVVDNGIES